MNRKIAPVLTALLADEWDRVKTPPPTREKAGDAQALRIAGTELRAVVSVVRAARRFREAEQGLGYDRVVYERARLDAALRRLSSPKPRRGTT